MEKKLETFYFMIILSPDLPLIGHHRYQILIKISMVLALKVNLGVILPFPVMEMLMFMFSEEIFVPILVILPRDLSL